MIIMIISIVLSLFVSLGLIFLKDRIVNSIPLIIYSILFGLVLILSFLNFNANIFVKYAPLCVIVLEMIGFFYLSLNTEFDFSKKIITLQTIKNKFSKMENGYHVLGTVVPHNVYSLKYNDMYLNQDQESTSYVTFVTGKSGSGKTRLIKSLAKQDIDQGRPVVFAEYKGDLELVEEIDNYAKSANYQVFKIFNDISDFNYDPFRNINNSSRIESLMNMRNWEGGAVDHYRQGTQLLLQKTIADFTRIWEKDKSKSYLLGYYDYMKTYNYSINEKDFYNTLTSMLSLLLESTLHDMFYFKYNKELDFAQMKNEKICVIISFPRTSRNTATLFTSLLVSDLHGALLVSGKPNHNIMFYGDETGILDNPQIMNGLITQGRSSNIATLLSFQDVFQMPEKMMNSWLGSASTFLIFNGTTKEAAEKLSGVQVADVDYLIMTLRGPNKEKRDNGVALMITKAPMFNKHLSSEVFKFVPLVNDKKSIHDGPIQMEKRSKRDKPALDVNDNVNMHNYSDPIPMENNDFDENKFQEESTNNYLDLL